MLINPVLYINNNEANIRNQWIRSLFVKHDLLQMFNLKTGRFKDLNEYFVSMEVMNGIKLKI
jgi:hypothetical protein